ncbi:response regulator transcription factor [uncultured Desulfobacter sp.]|uniref:response regulator transcription factor n=1 Tax=uncultured Desulfobacter sp. TaxID=240139 RepID=UPI0029F4AE00|nr:response regulator transcription factor [uncultured Desulfobacter sp.]
MKKGSVILVEDDEKLLTNLVELLALKGFGVFGASCALDFFQGLAANHYDVAIVDINLPDKSGFEIVHHLRENTRLGIIVMTARDTINDKVKGYESGADYYFVKPLHIMELEASINNLLYRLGKAEAKNSEDEAPGEWEFNAEQLMLSSPIGKTIDLTVKESDFIKILIQEYPNVVSRSVFLKALNYEATGTYGERALYVMITRLRSKIRDETGKNAPIKTLRTIGYCFSAPVKFV